MADEDYCLILNGNTQGIIRSAAAAKLYLLKQVCDLQARDKTLVARVERDGLLITLSSPGMVTTSVTHVLKADILKRLNEPVLKDDDEDD